MFHFAQPLPPSTLVSDLSAGRHFLSATATIAYDLTPGHFKKHSERLPKNESCWQNKQRTQSGNQPVRYLKIWSALTGTIQNQQLMSEQNGFGEDRSHTSGTTEPNKKW